MYQYDTSERMMNDNQTKQNHQKKIYNLMTPQVVLSLDNHISVFRLAYQTKLSLKLFFAYKSI